MVRLNYALVGEAHGEFFVQLDASESVNGLKNTIKTRHPDRIKCDPHELKLYSAKKDNKWVHKRSIYGVKPDNDGTPDGFTRLDSLRSIMGDQSVEKNFEDVHVLVVVPSDSDRGTKRQKMDDTTDTLDTDTTLEQVERTSNPPKRKWFQLVDSDENPITSATAVVVEFDDVASFLDAVVHKYRDSDHLDGIASSDLTVVTSSGEELEPQATLDSIGDTEILKVQVPVSSEQLSESEKTPQVEEAPDLWIQSLQEERVVALPLDLWDLRTHLTRELRVKIPITTRLSQLVSAHDTDKRCADPMLKLFEPCDACSFETGAIIGSVVEPLGYSSSRFDSTSVAGGFKYRLLLDNLIATVLQRVAKGTICRYSKDSVFTGFSRPDLCFYAGYKRACVFRGVEASCGNVTVPSFAKMTVRLPSERLYKDLIWRYGDAPYVFGYAAAEDQVKLMAIRPDSNKPRGATVENLSSFDLSKCHDRLWFLLALLNLSTLFQPVAALTQKLGVLDYGTVRQETSVKLSLGEQCVIKEYPTWMEYDAIISKLKMLHGLMDEHSVPNVVRLVDTNVETRQVLLSPLGYAAEPKNARQLVTALRDVLTALVALHKLNVMHRDIRWANVLKYHRDRDEWFLIDFDDAAMSPATEGATHLNAKSHAPEIAGPHGLEVDIWSVGYLLGTAKVHIPPQLQVIRDQCLHKMPPKRPTAVALLETMQQLLTTVVLDDEI